MQLLKFYNFISIFHINNIIFNHQWVNSLGNSEGQSKVTMQQKVKVKVTTIRSRSTHFKEWIHEYWFSSEALKQQKAKQQLMGWDQYWTAMGGRSDPCNKPFPRDLNKLSDKTPYHQVLWCLKAAILGVKRIWSPWNLIGVSAAMLPMHL